MKVIEIENISKKYILSHQMLKRDTFRGYVTEQMKGLFRKNDILAESKEEFWALNGVSFDIEQGDRMGIIGSNGAGKSTLLKILSRITLPTEGQIKITGRVASLLEVGTGFHPELTGRENVFLNGSILGMTQEEIRASFDEIVDFAGIEQFLDTPVKRYSSGMYVRLGFAIAAHLNPEIMIVDEVLAVGDADFQRKCLGKMKDVSRSGRTVLFVSHNLTAIQSLCNKGAFLEKGQLVQVGEVNQVLGTYVTRFSKARLRQEWTSENANAFNDFIHARSIEVVPQYVEKDRLDVRTPLNVRFEFDNLMEGESLLNLSMHLFSITGECVFNVATTPQHFSKGKIIANCEIPANLLNDGTYSITMMIVKDTVTVLNLLEESVTFEVEDYRKGGGAWYGKWPGTIRPTLHFPIWQELKKI